MCAGVEPDPFTIAVFQQLSASGEHKPATLARAVQPLLLAAPLPQIPKPNLRVTPSLLLCSVLEPCLIDVRLTSANTISKCFLE